MNKRLLLLGVCFLTGSAGYCADTEAEEAIKKFSIPENFEAKLWAAEPLLANPVAFSFDEQGRAFIAETHRLNNSVFDITQNTNWLRTDLSLESVGQRVKFLRQTFSANLENLTRFSERLQMVTDEDGDGRADSGQTIAEDFRKLESGLAAGVLARGTNLWFTCIPDLWRYLDGDGDGIPEKADKLHTGYGVHIGVTGHDLHGLTMGPDGRLYFSIGDRGMNVRAGGKRLELHDQGGVLRCEPDGSNLEIYATGMRNPQELAFDEFGNLFTGDNDTAGADKSRLLYVVEGGDYGWRFSYQHMRDFGPWVQENLWQGVADGTLPHSGDAAQGPSGLAYYPGTGLPAEYDGHFFICDFPGGIWSFETEPKGAGFELANKKKFVWNTWPTDVEFGSEEGIYFSDWVGGWTMPQKGRIYHLQAKSGVKAHGTKGLLLADFSERGERDLAGLLGFADYRVRQKAQFELARRGAVEPLLAAARGGAGRARIHAIWGLGQVARNHGKRFSWDALSVLSEDQDAEIRAQVARLAGEAGLKEAAGVLAELLDDDSPRVRFFAAQALGQIEAREAVPKLVEMARRNASDPFLVHPVVMAVARMASNDQLAKYAQDSELPVRRVALLAMRRNKDEGVARFLADEELVVEAARSINDVPIAEAFGELAEILVRPDWPKPALLRSLNANFRLGDEESARRLGAFVVSANAPAALRAEALEMLGQWAAPDEIDRVVGLWRPLPKRSGEAARKEVESVFGKIAGEKSEPILLALLNAARSLDARIGAADLVRIFDDTAMSSNVRVEALQTLAKLAPGESGNALERALGSGEESIRLLACNLAGELKTSAAQPRLVKLAEKDESVRVQQAALRALNGSNLPEFHSLLRKLAEDLQTGACPESLRLEVISALRLASDPALKTQLGALEATFSRALLAGGDREQGSRIFRDRQDVSCLRCHAVNGNGGTVGPDLARIGSSKSREYLLESIELPNKTMAAGYQQVVLKLKDGTSPAGLVTKETEEELVIDSPEDGTVRVQKDEIETRVQNLSAMPEGLDKMLTPYELRDLIEYLATLK